MPARVFLPMRRVAAAAFVALAAMVAPVGPAAGADADASTGFAIPTGRHLGDLEGMIERRTIRVLTVYSRTTFFIDNGTPRGVAYEALTRFGEELNSRLRLAGAPVEMLFIPVRRAELLPALADGRGDIAAAYLVDTPEYETLAAFTDPLLTDIRQIVVTGPKSPAIRSLDDLSGKWIFVRRSSSYWMSLVALNEKFVQRGKRPIVLEAAPDTLEDEDLLEMLNAGLLPIVVVDSHLARFWRQLLPDIRPHPEVAIRTGGDIAWAVRKDSPRLEAELDAFIRKFGVDTTFGAVVYRRYFDSTRLVRNATSPEEIRKFEKLVKLFRRYGDRYSLDWMLMAAQGYQESGLNQNVRSAIGAIGVMQLMPATGASLGVGNIQEVEPNIHGGVKYVRMLIDQHYADAKLDDLDRVLFALAAYNAGSATIARLREEAQRRGLDPNVWFEQVERVAAERVGRQTVDYVRNIYKCYIAYKLVSEAREARERASAGVGAARAR